MRGKQIHTPIWVAGSVLVVVLLVGGVAGGALTVRHGNVAFAAPFRLVLLLRSKRELARHSPLSYKLTRPPSSIFHLREK